MAGHGGSVGPDAVIMESVAALQREDAGPGGHAAAAVKAPPPKPPQAVAATYSIAFVSNLDCNASEVSSVDRSWFHCTAPEHSVSEARASLVRRMDARATATAPVMPWPAPQPQAPAPQPQAPAPEPTSHESEISELPLQDKCISTQPDPDICCRCSHGFTEGEVFLRVQRLRWANAPRMHL